jgi:hypothetical protein
MGAHARLQQRGVLSRHGLRADAKRPRQRGQPLRRTDRIHDGRLSCVFPTQTALSDRVKVDEPML